MADVKTICYHIGEPGIRKPLCGLKSEWSYLPCCTLDEWRAMKETKHARRCRRCFRHLRRQNHGRAPI